MAKRRFTYASVCDGIGAVHVAWQPLGWRCAWTSEIAEFPAAVVHARWGFMNCGDMLELEQNLYAKTSRIDLLVGGTPCQDFSLAGAGAGWEGNRGKLTTAFVGVVRAMRPRWIVWENVPGVFAAKHQRGLLAFVKAFTDLGYGVGWRVLDARYFGVPQQRRRVFIVAHHGDWRPAAAVLFDGESMCRNIAPVGKKRQEIARAVTASTGGCSAKEQQYTFFGSDGPLNPLSFRAAGQDGFRCKTVTPPIAATDGGGAGVPVVMAHGQGGAEIGIGSCHTLNCNHEAPVIVHALAASYDASEDGTGRGVPLLPVAFDCKRNAAPSEHAPAVRAMGHAASHANGGGEVAFAWQTRIARCGRGQPKPYASALTGCECGGHADSREHLLCGDVVRRATPLECERLQGFPDYYTAIAFKGKPASDSARYSALGNSMAVPVMAWIGQRIAAADAKRRRS